MAVTAMPNISFWQFWLFPLPPLHLMSLYSPESAVGMNGAGPGEWPPREESIKRWAREGRGWRERDGKRGRVASLPRAGHLCWQTKAGLQTPFVKKEWKRRETPLHWSWDNSGFCRPWELSWCEREGPILVKGRAFGPCRCWNRDDLLDRVSSVALGYRPRQERETRRESSGPMRIRNILIPCMGIERFAETVMVFFCPLLSWENNLGVGLFRWA